MKEGKIWEAWRVSTAEERCVFVSELCALYKPLIKHFIHKIEKELLNVRAGK